MIPLRKEIVLLPLAWITLALPPLRAADPVPGDAVSVASLGIDATGSADAAAKVQAALDGGTVRLWFPPGKYLLGSISLPAGARLAFSEGASVAPDAAALKEMTWLRVAGDDVQIRGLRVAFPAAGDHQLGAPELKALISGKGVSGLHVSGVEALRTEKTKGKLSVVRLEDCADAQVADSRASFLFALVEASACRQLAVRNNRATQCNHITLALDGCQGVLHEGNWSSQVQHQCEWWGGDADIRKKTLDPATASLFNRDVAPGTPGFVPNAAGAYDIQILGNYAEYGMTLGWGAKGRNVLIADNMARYMSDMCYDSEGSENVVIANNVAINARFFGIGCYFWNGSVLIANNLVSVEPEGDDYYQGDFLRMHSPNRPEFGAGRVLVTGNLFVGKAGRIRRVQLEKTRDITLRGNKFVNGRIVVSDQTDSLVFDDNEIDDDLPGDYSALTGSDHAKTLIVRNNVFRRQPNEDAAPVGEEAALARFLGQQGTRIVEGNVIQGWKLAAWTGLPSQNRQGPGIFRNNTVDGALVKEEASPLAEAGNIDPASLQPVAFRASTLEERRTRKEAGRDEPMEQP